MNLADQKAVAMSRSFLISFFCSLHFLFFVCSCRNTSPKGSASIVWINNKAASLKIPVSLLNDSSGKSLKIQLSSGTSDILGEVKLRDNVIFFEPLVPFTRGLHYKILDGESLVSEVEIPMSDSVPPELIAVYPSQDTVPENLLKMYLRFSEPMQEGTSLSYIRLLQNSDTLKNTFLDLQPELWNNDGTVLTLWLDPGRIKRDLIPNRKLGAPLNSNKKYTLVIGSGWRSKEGKSTMHLFRKDFAAASRDEVLPSPERWKFSLPKPGTQDAFEINFNESLDYSLANDAIYLLDSDGAIIRGIVLLTNEERTWQFIPDKVWAKGNYFVEIETRIEDLAGNNMNRPFDRNISTTKEGPDVRIVERKISIQ